MTVDDVTDGVPNLAHHAMSETIMETMTVIEQNELPEDAQEDDSIRVIDFH